MNPYYHSVSSVKKYGGDVKDYIEIHSWFDESKAFIADFRHRALRHHAQGIFQCEEKFGQHITNSDGKVVPVRFIGEQHVKEDLGRIPSFQDWAMCIKPEVWMMKPGKVEDSATTESVLCPDCKGVGAFVVLSNNDQRHVEPCGTCGACGRVAKHLLPLEQRIKFD